MYYTCLYETSYSSFNRIYLVAAVQSRNVALCVPVYSHGPNSHNRYFAWFGRGPVFLVDLFTTNPLSPNKYTRTYRYKATLISMHKRYGRTAH